MMNIVGNFPAEKTSKYCGGELPVAARDQRGPNSRQSWMPGAEFMLIEYILAVALHAIAEFVDNGSAVSWRAQIGRSPDTAPTRPRTTLWYRL